MQAVEDKLVTADNVSRPILTFSCLPRESVRLRGASQSVRPGASSVAVQKVSVARRPNFK